MARKQSAEAEPPTLESLPDLLRARAEDRDSLGHFSGPKTVNGVRMALLHLADIISGENKLVIKKEPVKKRIVA